MFLSHIKSIEFNISSLCKKPILFCYPPNNTNKVIEPSLGFSLQVRKFGNFRYISGNDQLRHINTKRKHKQKLGIHNFIGFSSLVLKLSLSFHCMNGYQLLIYWILWKYNEKINEMPIFSKKKQYLNRIIFTMVWLFS